MNRQGADSTSASTAQPSVDVFRARELLDD
jgi:hypothetical protein